jgi:hypothetical protein
MFITGFQSYLSLQPLVAVLKKMISEGKPGARRLYQGLINELESRAELLKPSVDVSLIKKDAELVETLLSTIFPPATTSNQGIYAITVPFRPDTVYASPAFSELFLKKGNTIAFSDKKTGIDIERVSLCLAYDLILKNFYGHSVPLNANSIHAYSDENGLTRYYDLRMNAQFVEVKKKNADASLPKDFTPQQTLNLEELKELLPLDNFLFEGLVVIEVNDVTQEHVITAIKTALLNINSFSDVNVFDELQQHVQSLIGLKNLQIGITPFFKMNGFYLYTEALYKNSLLFKTKEVIERKDEISELCKEVFEEKNQPLLYEILNAASTVHYQLLKYYYEQGAQSLILCPLKTDEGHMIGMLEILSIKAGQLQLQHLSRINPAIQLFTLALEKSGESMELQVDKMIKEHFTAIQPAVEWKFTEAAFNYLQHRQVSELAKMPNITFDNVFPLYAAIDVRNSSLERNHSIQLDLLEQLNMGKDVLEKAGKIVQFPLLQETQFRIEKYISSVSDNLLSDDELLIYDFLENDLDEMFINMRETKTDKGKLIIK